MIMNVNNEVKVVIQAELGMEVGEAVGIKYRHLLSLAYGPHIQGSNILAKALLR